MEVPMTLASHNKFFADRHTEKLMQLIEAVEESLTLIDAKLDVLYERLTNIEESLGMEEPGSAEFEIEIDEEE